MKINKYIKNNIVYFAIATLLIIFLFPKKSKFRYSFMKGKPWQYGLLTAPYNFPIYKSSEQLKAEMDSLECTFIPYFQYNENEYIQQQERFETAYALYSNMYWHKIYKHYIDKMLKAIYKKGIISNEDYNFLQSSQYNIFKILQNDNKTTLHTTDDIFTIKSAYSYLMKNCPSNLNIDVLRSIDLIDFLHVNLKYDSIFSNKIKHDDLLHISLSSGMVQVGERIIDQGEIINMDIYNILNSLKQIEEHAGGSMYRKIGLTGGIFLLITGLMSCLFFYIASFRKRIYAKQKDVFFLLSLLTLFILLTILCIRTNLFNVYIIPYAIIPVVIRTFFESQTAKITHLITILICALMVPFSFEFILIQFFVCSVALYVLKDLSKRSELIMCAICIIVTYITAYIGIVLFQNGTISDINWNMFIYFGINFLFVMFTYAFIYIIEKFFGYISNVTLIELSDINLPILIELAEKCPGTFQHSLQVSMLGTAAAVKVNANPQLVRTGALYHDLGKMENPAYFTENKIEGNNPHNNLTLEQSAQIITNHVPVGVKIARNYRLPSAIIKFILTHHGTGKAKYFYNSFKNQYPNKSINEEAFTYSGINPDTKESAILMMADSVEAASRSLKDYREESIRTLVNRIIDGQINDKLLNDAPLTFQNISTIKDVFVEKLLSVHHSRINYPEMTQSVSTSPFIRKR